jgi:hypothetical protein
MNFTARINLKQVLSCVMLYLFIKVVNVYIDAEDDFPIWVKILIVIGIAGVLIFVAVTSDIAGKQNRAFMAKCIEACRPLAVADTQRRYDNCICDNTKKSVEVK